MTVIVRIDVDGTVHDCAGDRLLATAREYFGGDVDVCTGGTPSGAPPEFPQSCGPLVLVCAERAAMPGGVVNVKAWALYGRSPLCGPVFVAHDQDDEGDDTGWRMPLDDGFIAALRGDQWLELMNEPTMRSIALGRDLVWPT